MSGLKVRDKLTFLKVSNGKFFLSEDKENLNPYDELTGLVVSIRYKTQNFNGADNEYLEVGVKDSEGTTYCFSTNVAANSYRNLVGYLGSADLSKPITFQPYGELLDTGKISNIFFAKQDGNSLKTCFPKKGEPGALPAWNKIRLNGKDVWDKTDFLEGIKEKALEIASRLQPVGEVVTTSEVVDSEEDAEDLPF